MHAITVKAYGKINPTLEVLGKKEDGFYSLALTWHRISRCDEVSITLNNKKDVIIASDNASIPQGSESFRNNCYRAVKLLESFVRQKEARFAMPGMEIYISKKLPLCGGLGGSATDAASVFNALIALLELPVSLQEKNVIAGQVGHDCAFFCQEFSHARGEELTPQGVVLERLPCLDGWAICVSPNLEINAGHAYAGLESQEKNLFLEKEENTQTRTMVLRLQQGANLRQVAPLFCNHLEYSSATFALHPILEGIKTSLKQAGCLTASMSGSGSTIFGVVETQTLAEKIKATLQMRYPNVFIAKFC